MVDDVASDVAAWVAQPTTLMRGESSPIALRIHAAPLDLSANGDLVTADKTLFHGHMAMSAPSFPALLTRLGEPTRMMMPPFASIALKGDTTIAVDRDDRTSIDLQALELDLDGNHYEGTLEWESGAKPSLSGTLATDTLTLAPFLAAEPSLAGRRSIAGRVARSSPAAASSSTSTCACRRRICAWHPSPSTTPRSR